LPNFVRFDAGMLKLLQMIKWDVFWDTVYIERRTMIMRLLYKMTELKHRFTLAFIRSFGCIIGFGLGVVTDALWEAKPSRQHTAVADRGHYRPAVADGELHNV